ncbi:polysaccharide polymerase [Lentilactobacillus sp. G22-6]|uniref:polysaccharide polymerase n=1 Tax=Lentilactobacillus dabitei TaxID=2831523 RepID=UPI001C25DF5F|nr:polysaccharide polymerase [Lentilactobacillus dabitei]MBU9790282.1 polysaccharide polymerase [Lentilactobacillus dabitei]
MDSENMNKNIGVIATKVFIFTAITISIMAILNGANIISNNIASIIQVLSIVPILILVVNSNNRFSITFVFALVISIMICIINGSIYMISGTMMIVFIYALNNIPDINYQKILKWLTFISAIMFGIVLITNLLTGWGSNNYEMWRVNGFIFRKSLGFSQPNITMLLWLSIILTSCSLNIRMERLVTIFIGLSTYIIYTQTQSRTSTYVIMLYCFISLLMGKHVYDRRGKIISKCVCIFPIIIFFISLYVLLHPYSLWADSILSGRLNLYQQFYATYGIHFLKTPELEYAMFDNGYLQSLLAKGIIFTTQLLCILVSMGWKIKQMRIKDMLLFSMYIIVGFTETALQHFELFLPIAILLAESYKEEQRENYLKRELN